VSTCFQLVELDALVMGELGESEARALRAHVETCSVCATEMNMLAAERALFTHRAAALEAIEPLAMPARASTEKQALPRFLPALGRIALRGHFTAACAAALFVVASLSRLGTASVSMSISHDVASISGDEGAGAVAGARTFVSVREQEPLACSLEGSDWQHGIGDRSASTSGGSRSEILACVDTRTFERAIDARTCEPFTQARE